LYHQDARNFIQITGNDSIKPYRVNVQSQNNIGRIKYLKGFTGVHYFDYFCLKKSEQQKFHQLIINNLKINDKISSRDDSQNKSHKQKIEDYFGDLKNLHVTHMELNLPNTYELPDHLPQTLKSVFFNRKFNSILEKFYLPDCIKHIEFGHHYNQYLPECLPTNLETLVFGESYNKPLPENLPSSIRKIIFGRMYNQILPLNLPQSLYSIEFGLFYNQYLPENLPQSLRKITFGAEYNKPLPKNIPLNLEIIIFGVRFNQPLGENLPDSLMLIHFKKHYNHPLPKKLPKSLNCIIFGEFYNYPLPEYLPQHLERIAFGDKYDHALPGNMNCALKELKFGERYNQVLPNSLPDSIEKIIFGSDYEKKLPLKLPSSLKEIQINSGSVYHCTIQWLRDIIFGDDDDHPFFEKWIRTIKFSSFQTINEEPESTISLLKKVQHEFIHKKKEKVHQVCSTGQMTILLMKSSRVYMIQHNLITRRLSILIDPVKFNNEQIVKIHVMGDICFSISQSGNVYQWIKHDASDVLQFKLDSINDQSIDSIISHDTIMVILSKNNTLHHTIRSERCALNQYKTKQIDSIQYNNEKITKMSIDREYLLLLTEKNNIYVHHTSFFDSLHQLHPHETINFKHYSFETSSILKNQNIMDIQAKNSTVLILTYSGKLFIWDIGLEKNMTWMEEQITFLECATKYLQSGTRIKSTYNQFLDDDDDDYYNKDGRYELLIEQKKLVLKQLKDQQLITEISPLEFLSEKITKIQSSDFFFTIKTQSHNLYQLYFSNLNLHQKTNRLNLNFINLQEIESIDSSHAGYCNISVISKSGKLFFFNKKTNNVLQIDVFGNE